MCRIRRESTRVGVHDWVSSAFRIFGGTPCFQVYGRGRAERHFHVIDIYAADRRNRDSRWPLFRNTCITWTANLIAVGWDFAETFLQEQIQQPATRENPITVVAGRLRDNKRRLDAGGPCHASASELMAHECGHTAQARRMGGLYWILGAMFTQFREGEGWWHHFENQASEIGMLGGIVEGSVCSNLQKKPNAKPV